jgi:S-(hydroxymethyl)glutathione dehydrogenase/alcohol dehydrogenase
MKCHAAIIPAIKKPFFIEEVELSDPKPNEARIRVKACSVCHSDIHTVLGEHEVFEGSATAGHEVAGIVDAVGSDVTYVKKGDHVLATLVKAGCGTCSECLSGRFCRCLNNGGIVFKQKGPYTRKNGDVPLQTAGAYTGFAEYTNVPENNLVRLEDDIPFEVGAILSCAMISGFFAVQHRACVKPFESVAVIGCGGVGMSAVQGARFVGAFPVIAVDTQDTKLDRARLFGATHTVNPSKGDPVLSVKEICNNYGAEHVILSVAARGLKSQAFDMLQPTGRLTIIGHASRADEFLSDLNALDFMKGKVLTGSAMGAVTTRLDIPRLCRLYRHGLLKVDEMIDGRFELAQINEAFDGVAHGGALKNVVVFS